MDKFLLRITNINDETGAIISVYESEDHGWEQKEHFLDSLSKYNGRDAHTFIKNGYQYLRKEMGVITKVEAVDALV